MRKYLLVAAAICLGATAVHAQSHVTAPFDAHVGANQQKGPISADPACNIMGEQQTVDWCKKAHTEAYAPAKSAKVQWRHRHWWHGHWGHRRAGVFSAPLFGPANPLPYNYFYCPNNLNGTPAYGDACFNAYPWTGSQYRH